MKRILTLAVLALLLASPAQAFKAKAATYSGNGSSLAVTGVGFQPNVVIARCDNATAHTIIKISSMASSDSAWVSTTTGVRTDRITAINSDGFTVSAAEVNTSGTNNCMYFAAATDANNDMAVGSYTGDAADNRSITISPAFQPEIVLIRSAADGVYMTLRTASHSSDDSSLLTTVNVANAVNYVQALNSNGFEVGTALNASSTVYHYVAFKAVSNGAKSGAYTGDGADNRAFTGVGFLPIAGIVKVSDASAGMEWRWALSGDLSWRSTAGATANGIQSFDSGGFTVGTNGETNANTKTYYWAMIGIPTYTLRRPTAPVIFQ